MSITRSWAEVIRAAVDARVADIHTALPAQVVSYDASKQTVDVQPLLQRVYRDDDGTEKSESFPQIPNVPVAFPRAGGYALTFPVAAGDTVLLVFAERALDQWRARDKEVDPGDLRMHDLSDAVAIPGVYASAKALTNAAQTDRAVFGKDGGLQVAVKAALIEMGEKDAGALDFVALAQKVLTELTNIVNAFNTHTHPHPYGPTSAPTAPMSTPASVAASKVKAQ